MGILARGDIRIFKMVTGQKMKCSFKDFFSKCDVTDRWIRLRFESNSRSNLYISASDEEIRLKFIVQKRPFFEFSKWFEKWDLN